MIGLGVIEPIEMSGKTLVTNGNSCMLTACATRGVCVKEIVWLRSRYSESSHFTLATFTSHNFKRVWMYAKLSIRRGNKFLACFNYEFRFPGCAFKLCNFCIVSTAFSCAGNSRDSNVISSWMSEFRTMILAQCVFSLACVFCLFVNGNNNLNTPFDLLTVRLLIRDQATFTMAFVEPILVARFWLSRFDFRETNELNQVPPIAIACRRTITPAHSRPIYVL